MENNTNNFASILWFVIIFVVIYAMFGGNLGGRGLNNHECGCVSNCEVQKQEIIDNARNLYAIETTGNRTIEANNLNTQRLYDQSARQYEAGLQEKIFDLKINAQTTTILNGQEMIAKDGRIDLLEKTIRDNEKFNVLMSEVSALRCAIPARPPYYAQGYVPTGCEIPCSTTA